jgi:hypothetical protein
VTRHPQCAALLEIADLGTGDPVQFVALHILVDLRRPFPVRPVGAAQITRVVLAGRGRRATPGTVPSPETAPGRGAALPSAPATGTGAPAALITAAIAPVIAPVIEPGAGPPLTAWVLS